MATSCLAGSCVVALEALVSSQILEEWDLNFRSGLSWSGGNPRQGCGQSRKILKTSICCKAFWVCKELLLPAFQESGPSTLSPKGLGYTSGGKGAFLPRHLLYNEVD